MKCAAIFVTDSNLFSLTQQAAAAFMLTNADIDIVIYCDGFTPPANDAFVKAAGSKNILAKYESISSAKYEFDQKSHVSRTMLCKFDAICHAVRDYERILYLDGDIIVFSPLPISDLSFDGHPIAAVYDIAEMGGITDPSFKTNVQLNNLSRHYFNSGVIIVDSNRWDEVAIRPFYEEFINRHNTLCGFKINCVSIDQCVFNLLFQNNWKRLPLSFNMQACAMFCERWVDASVRHYVGRKKFLPVQFGRNDAKDLKAINEARAILGFSRIKSIAPDFLYKFNKIRHAKMNKKIRAAMEAIELLYPSAK